MAHSIASRSRSRSNEPEPADWSSSTVADSPRDPYDPLTPPEQVVRRSVQVVNPPLPPIRGPQLTPLDAPRVNAMVTELTAEIRGRERFQDFAPADILWAAETFVRYRIPSLASLRRTDREARAMFIKDLREVETRSFPEIQLILQLLNHFAPQQVKFRPNDKKSSLRRNRFSHQTRTPRKLSGRFSKSSSFFETFARNGELHQPRTS